MLHEKSCLIINMPKIMIINYQQFAKTNTFSFSFHILFSPFLHIFPHFSPRHIEIRIWRWAKMGKNGVGPPPPPIDRYITLANSATVTVKLYIHQTRTQMFSLTLFPKLQIKSLHLMRILYSMSTAAS